ncbi:hypothetical protein [Flavobacterium notoginsengisoli]|uniref:hypothetical protein n=1 Tax=Flavobacterium notoginsengisoli TaxID=1478199 RepID=UPI003643C4D3
MKRLITLFIFMALFISCKPNKSPKETVAAFREYTYYHDFENADFFLIPTEENREHIEILKKMALIKPNIENEKFKDIEKNVFYKEKEITDSTAQIIVRFGQSTMSTEFKLKKNNKKWLIESIIQNQ